jgi:dihydropteroate synthase
LKKLNLSQLSEPLIMGILNVTPDSFSDGAQYLKRSPALAHADKMLKEGADIIDIGGESTRPGAAEVSTEEEINRVIPLVTELKKRDVLVSVDTSKTQVMQAAADAGADMINDVRALTAQDAIKVVAESGLAVCLMHMQGQPSNMQQAPQYDDVLAEVKSYLEKRIAACISGGIAAENISIDPGFGFGKTLEHNLTLLNQLSSFSELNLPVLAGISRKSMLGEITGRAVNQRLAASLSVALMAMQQGAKIIRVHDVKETLDVKKIYMACLNHSK